MIDNLQAVSVSQLSIALKGVIEQSFGQVRVRGEISGFRGVQASGHCYFALKDSNAKIDIVVWKGVLQRLKVRPEEGMEVILTGKITTFAGKSAYQLVLETLEPAGIGALMAVIEARKRKLLAEGLFADERKRPLPFLPRIVGVVTSSDGAVIRDIIHRLNDRFPVNVLIWPVRVQGETSAAEMTMAVTGFNELKERTGLRRPDVVIIARGGGSVEDLWSFNDETLVRAVAGSTIPIISAVGHETDWTLVDFAADRRAPTPTAAAELVVPVRADLLAKLQMLDHRLLHAIEQNTLAKWVEFQGLLRLRLKPQDVLASPRQSLDIAVERIQFQSTGVTTRCLGRLQKYTILLAATSISAFLAAAIENLKGLSYRLALVRGRETTQKSVLLNSFLDRLGVTVMQERRGLDEIRSSIVVINYRISRAVNEMKIHRSIVLNTLSKMLSSLDYNKTLKRGFVIVRNRDGQLQQSVHSAKRARRMELQFFDGRMNVSQLKYPNSSVTSSGSAGGKSSQETQSLLFDGD